MVQERQDRRLALTAIIFQEIAQGMWTLGFFSFIIYPIRLLQGKLIQKCWNEKEGENSYLDLTNLRKTHLKPSLRKQNIVLQFSQVF